MVSPDRPDVTQLLRRLSGGDSTASDELLALVYDELHGLARGCMRGERGDHTLQATALVHEAWMRLAGGEDSGFEDRGHFFRTASRAMRHVLVDHARTRNAEKHGGGRRPHPLDEVLEPYEERGMEIVPLDDALTRLERFDSQLARIVELRWFGGLSNGECAATLDVSVRTIERGWFTARAWLRAELGGVRTDEQ